MVIKRTRLIAFYAMLLELGMVSDGKTFKFYGK
jgi:hypothetical protein